MTGIVLHLHSATPAELEDFLSRLLGLATRFQTQLDRIEAIVTQSSIQENIIVADLAALTSQVTANTDAEASAVQLITNIAGLLKAAGTDPVAIAALQTQLETSRSALAAAVVANTPAA